MFRSQIAKTRTAPRVSRADPAHQDNCPEKFLFLPGLLEDHGAWPSQAH